jgi:hypothetical protein
MADMAVSWARVDISPSLAVNPWMGGYGCGDNSPREATADAPYTPLFARCVVVWDGDTPNAIVTADVLAFPRSMHQAIRQKVAALSDRWASPNFVLTATHTHNGPVLVDKLDPFMAYGLTDLTQVTDYSNRLQDEIVGLVQTALEAPRTQCTLDYQVASQTFSYNREGLPYNETAVPVLVARDAARRPLVVVFSYGCHPVSAGRQTQWDGDFPAGAATAIEESTGAFAMFLPGPAGDQDPTGGMRNFTVRDQLSGQLGGAVTDLIASEGRAVSGPIQTSYQETILPLDVSDSQANLDDVKADYMVRQGSPNLTAWARRHASRMIQQIEAGTFVTTVPLPIQVWKLQGTPLLRLAFVGGELVSGYAVYFRNVYGGPVNIYIGGYANEIPAYIPSDELLRPIRSGGSYGGGWDTDYPGIAGGSMAVYGYVGHFRAAPDGVEQVLTAALTSQLA